MLRNACTGHDKVICEIFLDAALRDNVAANSLYLRAGLCSADKRVPEQLKLFDSDFEITTVLPESVGSVSAPWKQRQCQLCSCVSLSVCVCLTQLQESNPSLIFSTVSQTPCLW